jgi:hypothetical protein
MKRETCLWKENFAGCKHQPSSAGCHNSVQTQFAATRYAFQASRLQHSANGCCGNPWAVCCVKHTKLCVSNTSTQFQLVFHGKKATHCLSAILQYHNWIVSGCRNAWIRAFNFWVTSTLCRQFMESVWCCLPFNRSTHCQLTLSLLMSYIYIYIYIYISRTASLTYRRCISYI